MKFRVLKRILLLFFALIGIGFFIFLIIYFLPQVQKSTEELLEEIKKDKIPPATALLSPEDKSWHNRDFIVEINDSDLGSGLTDFKLREAGCKYIIEDLGTGAAAGGFRKCDSVEINVAVGEGKVCSSSYQKEDISQGKCKVSSLAIDKAGNDSNWKSKVFNVDLIKPKIGQADLKQNSFELNKDYVFEASVSDNRQITGCWFYANGENTKRKVEINPIPCQDERDCRVSVNYTFGQEGDYNVNFICSDIVGNLGYGEYQTIKVAVNHPPEISSCRVSPTQGTSLTEFQFKVEATDPEENDELFFSWDFGDGQNSPEKNPKHYYPSPGTFEPKVQVADVKGEKSECQTAWVVVSQN